MNPLRSNDFTHFPLTLRDAPCLKCEEDELSSCRRTRAPEGMGADAIETPTIHRKFSYVSILQ